MAMCDALEVVVIWVLGESAVEESPRQIIYGVLFVFNGFGDDFCVEVIVKPMIQMALKYKVKLTFSLT